MNMIELGQTLASIDHRPAHPEDYEADLMALARLGVPYDKLVERVKYLRDHPEMVGGYFSCREFLKTGRLYDEYNGELLHSEE